MAANLCKNNKQNLLMKTIPMWQISQEDLTSTLLLLNSIQQEVEILQKDLH